MSTPQRLWPCQDQSCRGRVKTTAVVAVSRPELSWPCQDQSCCGCVNITAVMPLSRPKLSWPCQHHSCRGRVKTTTRTPIILTDVDGEGLRGELFHTHLSQHEHGFTNRSLYRALTGVFLYRALTGVFLYRALTGVFLLLTLLRLPVSVAVTALTPGSRFLLSTTADETRKNRNGNTAVG